MKNNSILPETVDFEHELRDGRVVDVAASGHLANDNPWAEPEFTDLEILAIDRRGQVVTPDEDPLGWIVLSARAREKLRAQFAKSESTGSIHQEAS